MILKIFVAATLRLQKQNFTYPQHRERWIKEVKFVSADLSTITPKCGKFKIFFDRSQVDGVDMRPISYVIITKNTSVVLFIKRSTEKGRSFRYGARGACFTGIVTAALSPERAIFWQKSSV